ncbi:MbtH family NRPS accessory protein [Ideonella sp.]|jgi:MbtH protein|uniref:MbtH family NRPS accessory protein n=1 Tax=Ideonella sp. TaxID=1929293 RepID=UPI0037C05F39
MHDSDDDLAQGWQWIATFNDEAQWAIWPEHLPLPAGWQAHGPAMSKEAALKEVEAQWTDMRPLSVR